MVGGGFEESVRAFHWGAWDLTGVQYRLQMTGPCCHLHFKDFLKVAEKKEKEVRWTKKASVNKHGTIRDRSPSRSVRCFRRKYPGAPQGAVCHSSCSSPCLWSRLASAARYQWGRRLRRCLQGKTQDGREKSGGKKGERSWASKSSTQRWSRWTAASWNKHLTSPKSSFTQVMRLVRSRYLGSLRNAELTGALSPLSL